MVSRKVLILLGCALLSLTLLFLKEIHALSISPMMTHVILASLVVEMAACSMVDIQDHCQHAHAFNQTGRQLSEVRPVLAFIST